MSTENTSSEPVCEFWHGTGRSRNQAKRQAIGEAVQSISRQFRDVQPVRSPSLCKPSAQPTFVRTRLTGRHPPTCPNRGRGANSTRLSCGLQAHRPEHRPHFGLSLAQSRAPQAGLHLIPVARTRGYRRRDPDLGAPRHPAHKVIAERQYRPVPVDDLVLTCGRLWVIAENGPHDKDITRRQCVKDSPLTCNSHAAVSILRALARVMQPGLGEVSDRRLFACLPQR